MKVRKFSFLSLGCKVNQAELDVLHRLLLQNNWQQVKENEKADLCIINTCTVTNIADRKSRQKIRRVIKDNPGAFIIVTGCYAESKKQEVEKISGVSLVLGNEGKKNLPEILKERFLLENITPHNFDFISEGRTRVFLKIQEGCENFCSYCIIPFVRGKIKSLPREEVINKINSLSHSGYKEIVITGINLGAYGKDLSSDLNLTELLRYICEKTSLKRLRLSSIEPLDIDISFLNLFNEYKILCPHLHIPLQYGHNSILNDMNRHYTVEQYREIVNLVRSKIDDVSVTTDVMVGFPGEKDEHFIATGSLIEELSFSKLHVFCYSPREGTRAAGLPEQIDEKTKQERSRVLIKIGENMTENFYRKFIGRTMEVLFEHRLDKKTGLLKGLTGNYLSVMAEGSSWHGGQILPVKIISLKEKILFGEIAVT